MTKPLSNDLRERLVSAVDSGLSRRSAARRFGVAASTAIKWVNRWRRTGDVGPRPQGGDHRSHRIEAHAEEILALVDETPDITLGEIAAHLDAGHGLTVAQSTVWRLLDRHGMTFKKTAHACEQQRADVLRRRQAWFDAQPDLKPERLVFIDETGASTKMARRYGRAPRGERCQAPVPHGHWKTTTFVGALRLEGMTAPMVLDGAMHGAAFLAYVEQVLVPTLKPGDIVVMDKDGMSRHVTLSGVPVFDDAGNFRGYRGSATDVTERKRAEAALIESEATLQARVADLEEVQRKPENQGADLVRLSEDLRIASDQSDLANRAKSEFLANMSHELRTPLNAIIGFAEILSNELFGALGNSRYLDYAKDIHESGHHLLALINDILDLSKIEAGNIEIREEVIDIPEVIQSCVRLSAERAQTAGVDLVMDLPEGFPPALRADKRMVKQIVVNLLSNAVKFTPPGGRITLTVRHDPDGGCVLQVADTSIGIAPENISKALARFGQVDGEFNRKFEGTGLGLPLSQSLVELHGGSLEIESELGAGTTVTVRFPPGRVVQFVEQSVSQGRSAG